MKIRKIDNDEMIQTMQTGSADDDLTHSLTHIKTHTCNFNFRKR